METNAKPDTEKELDALRAAHISLAQQSAQQQETLAKYADAIERAKTLEHTSELMRGACSVQGKSWNSQNAKLGGK